MGTCGEGSLGIGKDDRKKLLAAAWLLTQRRRGDVQPRALDSEEQERGCYQQEN
jgi:hypothetical protein